MNTPSTNPITALSRWAHFSRNIRGLFGVQLSAGLTAALLFVVFMNGCKEESPGIVNVCVAPTAPTVIRTSPVNGGTNEPLSKASGTVGSVKISAVKKTSGISKISGVAAAVKTISATFSTPMDPSSISTATFTVWQGTTPVIGGVSYTDTTALFVVPNGLEPNLQYTCIITTGAKNTAGTALANNYVWSFTTGAAASIILPTVSSTDPANAATGVALNQKIAATFSVVMNASTITSSTFILRQGTTSISGFVSYSGTTATFAPTSNLAPNTAYTATITTGVKDTSGHAMANSYVWGFTTGAAVVIIPPTVTFTDPANLATGVGLNQKIAAGFSVTMDASTITTSTFTLKQGTTPVSGFVSYSGTTAIFSPTSNLASNTAYTVTITTGAKNLAGIALANDYVWSFTTGAAPVITLPTVSSTDPANAATGVSLNQKIAATFSKTMDATTIQTSTFRLMQGTTLISGFVSYVGTTATFAPANNLLPNTTYSAIIKTGAKDLAGNALANDYVWSFTTGPAVIVVPPAVTSTDPANLATGVGLNQKIAASFSMTMDASTITASTFTLKKGATVVSGFVSYIGTTAIFAPTINLDASTVYTATITAGAKNLAGIALTNDYVWSFTTGTAVVVTLPTVTSTDPANLATGIPLNQKIAATFSKTMNASTITTATFTLKKGTTPVSGFVSYSGTTAIFAPATNLDASTVYTATITTDAKDLAGNALANDYVWTFTTGTAAIITPPTVSSTDPADAAACVDLNKQITATFSEAMDASTITTATFTLMQATKFVSGTVSYSGTTATYVPASNLVPNTVYTATITTGAKDLAGNSMTSNYVWSFTTVIPYTVTLSSNPSIGGTTSGSGTFNSCASVTVTATPNAGYTFTNWTENGTAVSTNASYTFTISGNRTLVATFTVSQYTARLSSNPSLGGTTGGVGFTGGVGTFNYGSLVTVIATPNAGYTFTKWTENGIQVSTNATYQFIITRDTTFVANFTAIPSYKVTLTANPLLGGTVGGVGFTGGVGTFTSGSLVTVIATQNTGYTFTNWTENGIQVSTSASYQFIVTQDTTFVANFGLVPVVDLRSASTYGAFGGTAGMTNTGILTVINGDIGTTATAPTSITGFHDTEGDIYTETGSNIGAVNGIIYTCTHSTTGPNISGNSTYCALATQARLDAQTAYQFLAAMPSGGTLAGNLAGTTITPGIYTNSSSVMIQGGDLTLDAGGDANAIFVFQIGSTLTVGGPGAAFPQSIILAGNAQAKNVFWQVGTSATINAAGGGTMVGTIIAQTAITFSTVGNTTIATLEGRALSLTAGVTLVDTHINVPAP